MRYNNVTMADNMLQIIVVGEITDQSPCTAFAGEKTIQFTCTRNHVIITEAIGFPPLVTNVAGFKKIPE